MRPRNTDFRREIVRLEIETAAAFATRLDIIADGMEATIRGRPVNTGATIRTQVIVSSGGQSAVILCAATGGRRAGSRG